MTKSYYSFIFRDLYIYLYFITDLRGHKNDKSVACQTGGELSGMTAILFNNSMINDSVIRSDIAMH